jgi:hypothetical protein
VGEDWFEPVFNLHTPLSPALTTFLKFVPLRLYIQNKTLSQIKKNVRGRHLLPLQVTTMPVELIVFRSILNRIQFTSTDTDSSLFVMVTNLSFNTTATDSNPRN